MRGNILARRVLFSAAIVILATGLTTAFSGGNPATGDELEPATLAELGIKALEKLPWEAHILSINMGKRQPMSIAAMYLMDTRLLVVSAAGRLYCLDRRNLEARWVNTLRFPLAKPPVESATHYTFLMKDCRGSFWISAISKRTGSEDANFPVRLPFSASSGLAANSAMVFVPSLGSPGNNRTLETINTVSGKRGWGYRTTGMLMAPPGLDPSGEILILCGDDGVITALSARATTPRSESWIRDIGGIIRGAPAVTPAHVLVANSDGILYNINLLSGSVNWLAGLEEPIRSAPVVFGGVKEIEKSTGVEGAAPIKVKRYVGSVFARNVKGLHGLDLETGRVLFTDARGGRPICRSGKYLVTCGANRTITLRDATDGYKVTGSLNLSMFDLIPTNGANGELYACTSDGSIIAVIPK